MQGCIPQDCAAGAAAGLGISHHGRWEVKPWEDNQQANTTAVTATVAAGGWGPTFPSKVPSDTVRRKGMIIELAD